MILNNNFAEHAVKLRSPTISVQAKQQLVTELRDSIEIVHTSEYANFLQHLFPAFHAMLADGRPCFAECTNRHAHPARAASTRYPHKHHPSPGAAPCIGLHPAPRPWQRPSKRSGT